LSDQLTFLQHLVVQAIKDRINSCEEECEDTKEQLEADIQGKRTQLQLLNSKISSSLIGSPPDAGPDGVSDDGDYDGDVNDDDDDDDDGDDKTCAYYHKHILSLTKEAAELNSIMERMKTKFNL